jgi:hypothetical protein
MRLFELCRVEDESGVSGTGTVAQGVEFDNGWCALTWLTAHTSVAFYTSIQEVEAIHGHNGKTLIRFLPLPEPGHDWRCCACGAVNEACRLGCWKCAGPRPA